MSSSPMSGFCKDVPEPNSSFMRRASTTVTMQSSRGSPFIQYLGSIVGMEQMVWAIGAGSQMPDASTTM